MKVLVIPDLHIPFHHRDAFDFLAALTLVGIDRVVCLGDEVDMSTQSPNHKPSPDGQGASEEFEDALCYLADLYELFPEAAVCTSNHTARPFRKASEAGIPKRFLKDYKVMLEAPAGWEWKNNWIIDGVNYEHGEGFSGAYAHRHAVSNRMRSTVIGHVHANAGVVEVVPEKGKTLYGMNAGCLIDADAYAFKYAANARTKVSLGAGLVVDGIPFYIPMSLTKGGRWTKKLILPN